MKNQSKARADGVLSPDDLKKAIEEYKARRAQRQAAAQGDNAGAAPAPAAAVPTPAEEPTKDTDTTVIAPAGDGDTPEEQAQLIKDRRDRRDAEGDPEDKDKAMGVIAQQDEDIGCLLDIIDTLLAERDFNAATGDGCGPKSDADEPPVTEPAAEPANDPEKQDSDDDVVPSTTPDEVKLNADSVDAIVRQRFQLGTVAQILNLDGLDTMPIMEAKKAVIAAVRPGIRLDGKSVSYIDAAFDCAVADAKKAVRKDSSYQKRQMFNRDSAKPADDGMSAAARREAMIARHAKKEEK